MLLKFSENVKKTDSIGNKNLHNNGSNLKRGAIQSQEFGSGVRRHSVYGHQNQNSDFG